VEKNGGRHVCDSAHYSVSRRGCGLVSSVRGGASPDQPFPRQRESGSLAGGQSTAIRERGAPECRRTEPGRALRSVEQSTDEEFRYFYNTPSVPLRPYGLPLGAAPHCCCWTGLRSQLSPHLVPNTDRGMEDQELTSRRGASRGRPINAPRCLGRNSPDDPP
jgi:hypothetical protein